MNVSSFLGYYNIVLACGAYMCSACLVGMDKLKKNEENKKNKQWPMHIAIYRVPYTGTGTSTAMIIM